MEIDYSKIESYSKCSTCGAITIYFYNDSNSSMSMATKRKLDIDLRKIRRNKNTYACNYCINHWGIDLCSCGSGKRVGHFDCGSNNPIEFFGEKYDSFQEMINNFKNHC